MALSECDVTTDEREKELKQHGSNGFPVAAYHDHLDVTDVPWHWHDEMEVAVVEQGVCRFLTGTEEIRAKTGEAVFVNSNVLHMCDQVGDGKTCILRSIVFAPHLIGGERDSVFWEKYIAPLGHASGMRCLHLSESEKWMREAIAHADRAWCACAEEPDAYEIRMRNELSLFVAAISAHIPEHPDKAGTFNVRHETRIKEMLLFIRDHYQEEIDTKAIATSANVSESEALRCFKKMLHTTPNRYLLSYRLEKAEAMLVTTEDMVSEIGARCGFQEMSYFAKAFQKKYGMPPKAYRQKQVIK